MPNSIWTRSFPQRWAVLLEDQFRTAVLVLNDDNTYVLEARVQPKLFGNPDHWIVGYRNFYSSENLDRVKETCEKGALIVEHWYLFGGSAPNRIIFDGYDRFVEYLHEHTKPGDILYCWDFDALCQHDNTTGEGKVPDELGRGFKGGAY